LLNLFAIKKLRQKLAFRLSAFEKVFGETGRVRQTSLKTHEYHTISDRQSKLTSSGTIFTRDANVFVAVDRISSSESLIRPKTGITKKITYGRALMSSFWTMSAGTSAIATEDIERTN
jgi:hypothetical protein